MNQPALTAQSEDAVSNGSVLKLSFLSTAHAALVIVFLFSAPEFKRMYAEFGVQLPTLSKAIFDHLFLTFFFLVACGTVQAGMFIHLLVARTASARRRFRLVALINLTVAALVMVLMYVPTIVLGELV